MLEIMNALISEAEKELFCYPETGVKDNIKYMIKRVIRRKNTPKRDHFFWSHALLAQALESAGKADNLEKYYLLWNKKGMEIFHPDNVMNGYSLLYLYEITGKEIYKNMADKVYEYILSYSLSMGSPIPYRRNHPNHVYVDTLGMVVPFLTRYGSLFGNREAINLGIEQIEEFLKRGMDEKTGLPYHGYDRKSGEKLGIIGWGRAVGWLLLSMADSLEYLDDSRRKNKLLQSYRELLASSIRWLRKDGHFSWQLTALEGPADTSATAMIGYGLVKARRYGEIIRKSGETVKCDKSLLMSADQEGNVTDDADTTLEKIKSALLESCKQGKVFQCSGECHGFSEYPQIYAAYPWSLGPAIRFLCNMELS